VLITLFATLDRVEDVHPESDRTSRSVARNQVPEATQQLFPPCQASTLRSIHVQGILNELIGVDKRSFQLEEHGKGVPYSSSRNNLKALVKTAVGGGAKAPVRIMKALVKGLRVIM